MKKTLLCAAVAAMTLAACSKNESTEIPGVTNDSKSINFSTATGTTRANDNTLAQLEAETNGFQVVGMTVPKNGSPSPLFTVPSGTTGYENNYKYVVDAWVWGSDTDKDWPTDKAKYPLQFFAFHPSTIVDQRFVTAYSADPNQMGAAQIWEIPVQQSGANAIVIDQTDPSLQEDYLFASTKRTDHVPTGGKEALLFKHIMSNVSFNVVLPEGFYARIQSLKVKNVGGAEAGDGTFLPFATNIDDMGKWVPEVDVPKDYEGDFSYFNATASVKYEGKTGAVPQYIMANNSAGVTTPTMKMMPQEKTTGWDKMTFTALYDAWNQGGTGDKSTYENDVINAMKGAHIELVYALVDKTGTNEISVVGKVNSTLLPDGTPYGGENRLVRVAFPLDFTATPWKQGTKYVYNIRLGMPDSTNGTVTDPDYKDDSGVDKPGEDLDNPAVTPGDDVTKHGKIGFTVDVDATWGAGADTDIK